jgi:hypothetical protein
LLDKKELLKNFYKTIDKTQMKIEISHLNLQYIDQLKKFATIDYCSFKEYYYQLRVSNVTEEGYDYFLNEHIAKRISLCCYFNRTKNSIFAFNLDSSIKENPALKIFMLYLCKILEHCGLHAMILKSGHGYHVWCGLQNRIENTKLQVFEEIAVQLATYEAVKSGACFDDIQYVCYPRLKHNDISIRLFGSNHVASNIFTYIVTKIDKKDLLLDENDSWMRFENYTHKALTSVDTFEDALNKIAKMRSQMVKEINTNMK